MNKYTTGLLSLLFIITAVLESNAQTPERSWYTLITGNGHGFQLFNRVDGKLDQFLEHPYRYVAPFDERRDGGISRRDLMHDAYFGVSVNGEHTWLNQLRRVSYEEQSNIILAQDSFQGLNLSVRYFAPFELEANALIMMLSIENQSSESVTVNTAAKVNLNLGDYQDRLFPNSRSESITALEGATVETGPGGGHAIYFPITQSAAINCGEDTGVYDQWLETGQTPSVSNCTGDNQVVTLSESLTIGANETKIFGIGLVFVNDTPNEPQADDFKDDRTVDDIRSLWTTYLNGRTPLALLSDTKDNFEAWRVSPTSLGLNELTADEIALWRQSETVLRMGQIREPVQQNRRNFGMFLAALPPGKWHIGWVRDGAYAIVAQAMAGHLDEAREGVEFFLSAWAGFFNSPEYLGRHYRISSVRYYGNGKEEGDFNYAGPNVETDGFGLALWAARAYMHYSCDLDWLEQPTLHGDSVYEALTQTAEEIDALLVNDLPIAECSIWETHWDFREVFTYTAATQIRGLYDFAAIAEFKGDYARASYFSTRADALLNATLERLVHPELRSFVSHLNVANAEHFVDGSTIEMLSWDFVAPDDPIYIGTMNEYARLQTAFGGYRRLEEQLSLTGDAQASEYDLSQWVLLDLRIGQAFRKMGAVERAETLLQYVTDSAVQNDHLVPELFNPVDGRFEGAIPMVGYGAGAWQVAQLEKYGYPFPDARSGWAHCSAPTMPEENSDMGVVVDAGIDQSSDASTSIDTMDAANIEPDGEVTAPDAQADPSEASTSSGCTQSKTFNPSGLLFFVGLLGCIRQRRRTQVKRAARH